MKRKQFVQTFFPPPSIDRRKRVHKHLDESMTDKWVDCTNDNGTFSGPYITHRHDRKSGMTILVYLCTQRITSDGLTPLSKVVVMGCTDYELDTYITITSHAGADQQKLQFFGTTNLNQIRNILKWNNYRF